jgi:DNA-binding response OmpR family regulator
MKKVLLVDDDIDLLSVMNFFLKKNDYSVRITTSCDEGLEIFYLFQPDLVLMDINVGTQDGREMCKTIKSHAEYQHIPVILISANYDMLGMYRDYGANNILKKPFEVAQLLQIIKAQIGS